MQLTVMRQPTVRGHTRQAWADTSYQAEFTIDVTVNGIQTSA